jgi:hypothetical protein
MEEYWKDKKEVVKTTERKIQEPDENEVITQEVISIKFKRSFGSDFPSNPLYALKQANRFVGTKPRVKINGYELAAEILK